MNLYKLLFVTVVMASVFPVNASANDLMGLTQQNIIEGGKGKVDRKIAISTASGLADCAAIFDGLGQHLTSEDVNINPALANQKANVFHNAAIAVWVNYGIDFTQINNIRESRAPLWLAGFNADLQFEEQTKHCNALFETSGVVVLESLGGVDALWK